MRSYEEIEPPELKFHHLFRCGFKFTERVPSKSFRHIRQLPHIFVPHFRDDVSRLVSELLDCTVYKSMLTKKLDIPFAGF
jgi:hypothetical protein